LPIEDGALVRRCQIALSERFDDAHLMINSSMFNPLIVWKLYGTLACKGEDTDERPHRMSRILEASEMIRVVDTALLESFAVEMSHLSAYQKMMVAHSMN
jgi:hypothetical protein